MCQVFWLMGKVSLSSHRLSVSWLGLWVYFTPFGFFLARSVGLLPAFWLGLARSFGLLPTVWLFSVRSVGYFPPFGQAWLGLWVTSHRLAIFGQVCGFPNVWIGLAWSVGLLPYVWIGLARSLGLLPTVWQFLVWSAGYFPPFGQVWLGLWVYLPPFGYFWFGLWVTSRRLVRFGQVFGFTSHRLAIFGLVCGYFPPFGQVCVGLWIILLTVGLGFCQVFISGARMFGFVGWSFVFGFQGQFSSSLVYHFILSWLSHREGGGVNVSDTIYFILIVNCCVQ